MKAKKVTKRKTVAKKKPKTKEVIILRSNYGYGWEDEVQYEKDSYAEAKRDYSDYRKNCKNASFKIVKRRVPNK